MSNQLMRDNYADIEKSKGKSEIRNSLKNDHSPSPKRMRSKIKLVYASGNHKNNKGTFSFSLKLS